MKSILLVDDHSMIRDALKQYLNGNKEFRIAVEAENGKQALDFLKKEKVDLLITDINMPVMNGLELVENVSLNGPNIPVLIISMYDNVKSIIKMMSYGVGGFIPKNASKNEFLTAIKRLSNGKKYFSEEITERFKSHMERKKKRNPQTEDLSSIEVEVLKMIVQDATRKEMLSKLSKLKMNSLSLNHILDNVYRKSGCSGKPGLALYAAENELI